MAGPVPDPGGFIRGRVLIAAVLLWPLIIHTALADTDVGDRNNGFSVADEKYLSKYEAAHKAGFDVGRNLLDSAWSDAEPVSDARIEASTATLERWLNPPEPEPVAAVVSESVAPAPVTETVAPSSVSNSTVMCESGGDYSANTGNGYYGGWQFDSQTWDAYGDPAYGEANEAPPAVQDAAAASVPYDAWPNC